MAFIAEGENVQYTGAGEPDAPITSGDFGVVVMAAGGDGSHVLWKSGEAVECISLTSNRNLQVIEASNSVEEEGYTDSAPHVHMAVCDKCLGEGLIPEE